MIVKLDLPVPSTIRQTDRTLLLSLLARKPRCSKASKEGGYSSMATTNLHPKRVTIFHQGCVEVYEKLGEHLKAEADRRSNPSNGPTPHSKLTGVLINLRI
jgi:hypothetical protein